MKFSSKLSKILKEEGVDIELPVEERGEKPEKSEPQADKAENDDEIDLDLEIEDESGSNLGLLSKYQDYLNEVSMKLNKIGIVLGSKFNDHSTRNGLSAIADQIQRMINSLNEKIVRYSSRNEVDVADLFEE